MVGVGVGELIVVEGLLVPGAGTGFAAFVGLLLAVAAAAGITDVG